MANIRQIMEICKVDQPTAFKIYDLMVIDFSECTKAEFKREALRVYKAMVV